MRSVSLRRHSAQAADMAITSPLRAFLQSRALVKAWRWPGIAGITCLTLALVVGLIWLPSLEH